MSKIIGKHWFTGISSYGIIVIETDVGERKAYLGHGVGSNEAADVRYISEYGAPVTKEALEQIIKEFK